MKKNSLQLKNMISGIKNREEKSFKILYDTFYGLVYYVVIKIVNNKQDAEELTQDTFVKVYNQIDSFDGENFHNWIYTIAKHTAVNFYQRVMKKQNHIVKDEEIVYQAKLEDHTISPLHEMLVKHFSHETADIIIQRAVFDFSFQHIADSMNLNKTYVYKNYVSSIERLKFLMEGNL
jgi:RNA polymerase sigma-70 factor (ECF subfamily)